jgi:hypothetical protein
MTFEHEMRRLWNFKYVFTFYYIVLYEVHNFGRKWNFVDEWSKLWYQQSKDSMCTIPSAELGTKYTPSNEYNFEFSQTTDSWVMNVLAQTWTVLFRVVFWVILPCKMIVDRRFRGVYCLHHQGGSTHLWNIGRQSEAVHTSETSVDNHFAPQYNLHHQGWVTHPWWWRQYAPLKRRSTIILQGSIMQETTLNIILPAVRTWNLTLNRVVTLKGYLDYNLVDLCSL